MKIPVIIKSKSQDSIITNLFEGNSRKDIVKYRAKLKFKNSSIDLESNGYTINAEIILTTPFGIASISDYLIKKLKKDSTVRIQIGTKWHSIINDEIKDTLHREYLKSRNLST